MSDSITTAERLVALSDPARNSSENERDSAARALAKMVREGKVKLSVSNEPGVRSAGGTDLTNDPGVAFDEESAVRRGRAAQRALDVQLCEAVVQAVGESVLSRREPIWNTTLAPQVSRLLRSVGRLAVNSVRSGRVVSSVGACRSWMGNHTAAPPRLASSHAR